MLNDSDSSYFVKSSLLPPAFANFLTVALKYFRRHHIRGRAQLL